jgi:hypothetical protein
MKDPDEVSLCFINLQTRLTYKLERFAIPPNRSGTGSRMPDVYGQITNMNRYNSVSMTHHRRSGIISKPIVARTARAAPKRNGADGPYQSHKSPAITLAGNAAMPKAALKIP